MSYVDGFVLAVPRANIEAYRAWARTCLKASSSFPQAVQLKDDEVVFFSWMSYASRAERDRINAAVMADPRLANMSPDTLPFDGKRMIFGGFSLQAGTAPT